MNYLEDISLYEMHIFKYSMRKGTRAAAMKEQVLEAVKTRRSAVLLEMEARKSLEYRSQFVDSVVKVLFEEKKEIKDRTYMVGHTREYEGGCRNRSKSDKSDSGSADKRVSGR